MDTTREKERVIVKGKGNGSNNGKKRVTLNQLKDKLKENSLYIGRIAPKAKARFKEFALKEFNDDYGVALAYLLDRYTDNLIMLKVMENINDINKRLNSIEDELSTPTVEEPQVIKTISGKSIDISKKN